MAWAAAARYLRRSRAERRLLMATAVLFLCAQFRLRTTRLAQVRASLNRTARRLHARAATPAQLQWCVQVTARALPGVHSCLIQALVCEAVAQASSIETELKIGAQRAADGHRFHAWVERDGQILAGGDSDGFVALA